MGTILLIILILLLVGRYLRGRIVAVGDTGPAED